MSYKPLHVETGLDKEALIMKQPLGKDIRTTTIGPQVPRHSIAISLTLAVLAYCCCSALGIIPIVMVIFAYVKREHGKAREATRMSNYSRCVSGIVIAIGIILMIITILYFIAYAYFGSYYQNRDMMDYDYFGDDMVYPEDYYNGSGDDYNPEMSTMPPDWGEGIDYIDDTEPADVPVEYDTEPVYIEDEGGFAGDDGE